MPIAGPEGHWDSMGDIGFKTEIWGTHMPEKMLDMAVSWTRRCHADPDRRADSQNTRRSQERDEGQRKVIAAAVGGAVDGGGGCLAVCVWLDVASRSLTVAEQLGSSSAPLVAEGKPGARCSDSKRRRRC